MNKRLSRILSAILILCMIPATVITAFARGKGVYGDGRDNQSLTNADGQYIPETIVVDGELNDTGWPESGFAYVDSNTGYWSTQAPTNTALNYKYQIRSDYDYLYVGASVTLPENVKTATVTVYFKDGNASAGYTDKLVFNIENGTVAQGSHEGVTLSAQGAESNLFKGTSSGNTYTLEFRNRLADTFTSTDISNVTYYISVTVEGESLYHPKMALSDSANVPTFDYWPVNTDGSMGGEFVATWLSRNNTADNKYPAAIEVDGNFDEAVWASLTNYYITGKTDPYAFQNGYTDSSIVDINTSRLYSRAYDSNNDGDTIRFKYELRVDKDYVYGAVVAYVPEFTEYTGTYKGEKYTVAPSPDLYVYFFGNDKTEDAAQYQNDDYNVDNVIQIRSNLNAATHGKDSTDVAKGYSKMYTTDENGKKKIAGWHSVPGSGFEGTRLEHSGNIWTFEFKVLEDYVPKTESGDIVFGIGLADRTQLDGFAADDGIKRNREFAWTGRDDYDNRPYYEYDKQIDSYINNIITADTIKAAKDSLLKVADTTLFTDGNLSQEIWAALLTVDYSVDSNARGTTNTQSYLMPSGANWSDIKLAQETIARSSGGRYMYKIAADREYIYGAAYIKLYNGVRYDYDDTNFTGKEKRSFRLWLNTNQGSSYTGCVIIPLDGSAATASKGASPISIVREITKTENGNTAYYYIVEFMVPVYNWGIDNDLTKDNSSPLFSYYTSVCTLSASGQEYEMVHPKANDVDNGIRFSFYSSIWQKEGDGDFYVSHLLDTIKVDGQLDEICWLGEDKMISIDASNGTWQKAPQYGNTLSYDYMIYGGSSFLYGAAIIDAPAYSAEKAYQYDGFPVTRFDIWIDNKVDEYKWNHDDSATTRMETDEAGNCYENYYYNIYYVESGMDEVVSPTGGYVCGGSTPNWYNVGTNGTTDIDLADFQWNMSTINGKTYVEFMIDLDNFHCDRSNGFNYYVSATQPFMDENGNVEEILTLFGPEIRKTNTLDMPATVYNWTYSEVFLTNNAILFDKNGQTNYQTAFDNLQYWEKVVFAPVATGSNVYEVKYIHHSPIGSSYDATYSNTHPEPALQDGWFAYALHYDEASPDMQKTLGMALQNLKDGDRVVITGLDFDELETVPNSYGLLLAHSYFLKDSTVSRENIITNVNNKLVLADGYRCSYGITFAKEYDIDNATYIANIPTASAWDSTNAGKIAKLTHFAPDVVKVDGLLKDSVWTESDGWIDVQDNVNGTFYNGWTDEKSKGYSYKLVTDGEYLYVALKSDVAYDDATSPSFTLWLKGNEAKVTGTDNAEAEVATFTHFYRISRSAAEQNAVSVAEMPAACYPLADGFGYAGFREGITVGTDSITLENKLMFGVNNTNTVPNEGKYVDIVRSYGESALFGYTEEIQENFAGMGEYYPVIKTTKTYLGKESGIMKSGIDGNGTVVEFKVALSEFGGSNGFEYFTQFDYNYGGENNSVVSPMVVTEPDSTYSYYGNNLPTWKWSHTAVKVTAEDIRSGAIRMRNNCVPVVTLGAKISSSYVANDGNTYEALRFGALYTEDYLRNWEATDKITLKPEDANYNEMYTAPMNDYWDVADVGIVMLPTAMLEKDQKLTLETPDALALSANDIVGWINSAPDGWSNFADYENFVFYATLYGVPTNVKVSFCGYVDFYASTDTESFYDVPIERSYDMVESVIQWDPIGE
ncbi:MAG: hypothetical protein IKK70_07550 [Clostridia bacterium]|nr:hypothetical protein [Clostridia bacterium]